MKQVDAEWLAGYRYATRDMMFRGKPVGGFARGKGEAKKNISNLILNAGVLGITDWERGYTDAILDSVGC